MFRVRTAFVACIAVLVAASCSPQERGPGGDIGDRGTRVSGGAGAATAPEIPADAPLVLFLGDSISAGLHLPASAAFPAVLQRDLARDGHPFRLVNAGVSGDTSSGGLSRLDWVLQQKPDVLVVELGGNDGLRGLATRIVEDNLRAIVTRARAAGASVLLLGVRMPTSYGTYSAEFDAIYPRIAADLGVAFVPYFMNEVGGVPDMLFEDGLHPTAKGHEILAANVAPKLKELVAAAKSR
jgi:acyl-CoA thioesterase I